MELWALWRVIRRRLWLVAIPTVIALAWAGWTFLRTPAATSFTTSIRLTAAPPVLEAGSYEDSFYYPWLTSEYVVNGLADWVQSGSFAAGVSERLEDGPSAAELAGRFAAQNARSVLVLHISWGDPEALAEIAAAAIETLQKDNALAFPQFDAAPAEVVAWDGVGIAPVPTPLSSRIQPFFRAALGFAAGLGLAFLFEYLDPALHTREDLEALGCDVVGEIPRR